MNLSELVPRECIELDLQGRKKEEILSELVKVFSRTPSPVAGDELYQSLLDREKLGSTGIGNGIAIPHAMMPEMENTMIAFGKKPEGAGFDSVDKQPVTLFFLLVGPENNPGLHLRVLSKLARYLHDIEFRQALLGAENPEEVVRALRKKDGIE